MDTITISNMRKIAYLQGPQHIPYWHYQRGRRTISKDEKNSTML